MLPYLNHGFLLMISNGNCFVHLEHKDIAIQPKVVKMVFILVTKGSILDDFIVIFFRVKLYRMTKFESIICLNIDIKAKI